MEEEEKEREQPTEEQIQDVEDVENNPESAKQLSESSYSEETENVGTPSNRHVTDYLQDKALLIGLLAIGAALLILIIFMIFLKSQDFNFYGNQDTQNYGDGDDILEHIEAPISSCSELYLAWENESYTKLHHKDEDYEIITDPELVDLEDEERWSYEEVEIDDYLLGVVWNDAREVDNIEVYKAVAIAARSHLSTKIKNNCVILKEQDDQNYTKVDTSEEHYEEIRDAINLTDGEVMVIDDEILSASYDTFCWVKKTRDYASEDNRSFYYFLTQENLEETQIIPSNWVKENNVPLDCQETEYKFLERMSMWGAKYLFEKETNAFDLLRVLKYYYGQDVTLKTIGYSSGSYNGYTCSDISMSTTSLTKEEFIAKVNASDTRDVFKVNAGRIYDMATSNGVNPELVVIRADVEGYSPGESYNNYWGINCTNETGIEHCTKYDTFDDGVMGFLKIASKYDTLSAFAGIYAYLGDYWYNPGSSSKGGCYYKTSAYPDGYDSYVADACSDARAYKCVVNGDQSGCVPTREEDREAYNRYQSKEMISKREKIFNLSVDECLPSIGEGGTPSGEGSCVLYAQSDSAWGSINLGSSKATMSSAGCAVTSIAMALTCSGVSLPADFNPGYLIKSMNKNGGFDARGNIYWNNTTITSLGFSLAYKSPDKDQFSALSSIAKLTEITSRKNDHTQVIVHLKKGTPDHLNGHYLVYVSNNGTMLTTLDSAGGKITTWDVKYIDQIIVYSY